MGNTLDDWILAIRRALDDLGRQDLGYPLGQNEVESPSNAPSAMPGALTPLYRVCDGMSLPDVHVGYFIDPSERVLTAAARGEPTRIEGESQRNIAVFGSDGGGGRFAVDTDVGSIYYLPSGGAVRNGVFREDAATRSRQIADDISAFLSRLARDVQAFSHDEQGYEYFV